MIRIATDRVLRDRTSKDYTIGTVTSLSEHDANRRGPPEPSAASVRLPFRSDASATRVDLALLFCALFLSRFSLPFGNTFLMLDLVPVVFILAYQFFAGKLLIQYDRLLWFLGFVFALSCSLLLNFKSAMLTSYLLFLVLYSLVTLIRPSTPGRYYSTLHAFQLLVLILSCIGVAQFFAQFVVDGKQLLRFYGLVPDLLFGYFNAGGVNTIHPLSQGSGILKSNGLFLTEPSTFSQITALGILIEILEFRRPRYLLGMASGFLVAFSGTGLMLLLLLPLAGLRHSRAGLSALLVIMFALALFLTGIIDPSVFLGRVSEFEDPAASGFGRFVAPVLLAAKQFDDASLLLLLVGNGPGTAKTLNGAAFYSAFAPTWFKLFIEYGIIGSFIFVCFLASCLKQSKCPGLVLAAMIVNYIFNVDFLTTSFLTVMIVLGTLNSGEGRQIRSDRTSGYRPASRLFPVQPGRGRVRRSAANFQRYASSLPSFVGRPELSHIRTQCRLL
jgi:hypothetical protein